MQSTNIRKMEYHIGWAWSETGSGMPARDQTFNFYQNILRGTIEAIRSNRQGYDRW